MLRAWNLRVATPVHNAAMLPTSASAHMAVHNWGQAVERRAVPRLSHCCAQTYAAVWMGGRSPTHSSLPTPMQPVQPRRVVPVGCPCCPATTGARPHMGHGCSHPRLHVTVVCSESTCLSCLAQCVCGGGAVHCGPRGSNTTCRACVKQGLLACPSYIDTCMHAPVRSTVLLVALHVTV